MLSCLMKLNKVKQLIKLFNREMQISLFMSRYFQHHLSVLQLHNSSVEIRKNISQVPGLSHLRVVSEGK